MNVSLLDSKDSLAKIVTLHQVRQLLYFPPDSVYHKYITYQIIYCTKCVYVVIFETTGHIHCVQKFTGMHLKLAAIQEQRVFCKQYLGDTGKFNFGVS